MKDPNRDKCTLAKQGKWDHWQAPSIYLCNVCHLQSTCERFEDKS